MSKLLMIGAVIALASVGAGCVQTQATRIATGAALGAGTGAIGAWAADEDPGQAALIGAGTGGIGALFDGGAGGGSPFGF